MAADRQKFPVKRIPIVCGGGEETARTSKSTDPQEKTTVSPRVHHSPSLLHNIPRPRSDNAMATQAFRSSKGTMLVVDYPSALSCYPLYSSMTQQHHNLYGDCCGPTHCHNGPPPSHGHVDNLPNMHPQFSPPVFGGTLGSCTIATIFSRSILQVHTQPRYMYEQKVYRQVYGHHGLILHPDQAES